MILDDSPPQPSVYVPASQQQVQEPKKYTGGAIPSRSFRILQAMTAPESVGELSNFSNPLQESFKDIFIKKKFNHKWILKNRITFLITY